MTENKYTLTVEEACEIVGLGRVVMREGIARGVFPFGVCVIPRDGERRNYVINKKEFKEYFGIDECDFEGVGVGDGN